MTTALNQEITKLFKKQKERHFNFHQPLERVLVSTGSLELDDHTGGGLGPGINTAFGVTEGGKTNFFLECMRNFMKEIGGLPVYIKSEGRLEEEIQKKHQLDFVVDTEKWDSKHPLLIKSQDYEFIINFINKATETCCDQRLCIILDSLDSVVDEGGAMMSTPKTTKDLLRRISLKFNEMGHFFWIIGQKTSKPQDKYTPNEQRDHIGMAGGHAVQHFSNWIFEFAPHDQKSNWLVDAEKNKIGHNCLIRIKKSVNNKSESRVSYPILYGRPGSEIWLEKELAKYMLAYSWVTRETPKSAFKFNNYIIGESQKLLKMENLPESFRTEDKLIEFFNDNKIFVDHWVTRVKEKIRTKENAF